MGVSSRSELASFFLSMILFYQRSCSVSQHAGSPLPGCCVVTCYPNKSVNRQLTVCSLSDDKRRYRGQSRSPFAEILEARTDWAAVAAGKTAPEVLAAFITKSMSLLISRKGNSGE